MGPISNMSRPRSFRSWLQPSRFSFLLAFMSGTAISQTPSPAPSSSDQGIGLRLLFKFETEEAKLAAIDLAGEEQLDFEIEETKMAVITVPSLEVLQALQALDGIEYAEADSAKSKFPYYGDDRSSPHDSNVINRRLDERQPYGIAMVQADQLWNITPAGKVDVCVVDTGIEDGHEDLPNSVVRCWSYERWCFVGYSMNTLTYLPRPFRFYRTTASTVPPHFHYRLCLGLGTKTEMDMGRTVPVLSEPLATMARVSLA